MNLPPKERKDLQTEQQNPNSFRIDQKGIGDILDIINQEDQKIAEAVRTTIPEIKKAVELTVKAISEGHRIFYVGAGTSGRLGVLDATEMPPTYSAPKDWFQGIIAGGRKALVRSIEGAEDHPQDAIRDMEDFGVTAGDCVIGIASSSATPYVVEALKHGREIGTSTVYLICNPAPLVPVEVDVLIAVPVGPEIITGSTRMKSGTATKMVLNMISTTTMIKIGKVYGNLMVDLQVVNNKLVDRGSRIIAQLSGLEYEEAKKYLEESGGSVKTAIVMAKKSCSKEAAIKMLKIRDGSLREVIGDVEAEDGNAFKSEISNTEDKMNKYIFREYDIRGKVSEDFPPEVVESLGKGFGTWAKRQGAREISLSGDIRLTTPTLLEHYKKGLLSTGLDVISLGLLPTPVNYYSMFKLDVDGAVQITGSHNPPEFNGFKMSFNRKAVYGKSIQEIREIIESGSFETGEGQETTYDLIPEYKQMIEDKITIEKPLKVVMDCGNAAGGLVAPEIFQKLGVELTELYCDIDGHFPNHHPDPTVKENLADLIKMMKTGKYDIGVAFDGDADRVGIVDDQGEIVWADQLMALFLPEVVEKGDEVLFDVKCSQALEDMIVKTGGKPVMWKTGHSLIKQRMGELKCKLGGEMSGHIFFADDYFGYDDAIYVAARAVQMVSRSARKLSDLAAELPKFYSTPELRFAAENDEEKFRIAKEAADYFKANYECITVDGVRIKFGDGWGLVRSSNTQPVIVCRFEATTPERMEEIRNIVMTKLNSIGKLELESGE